MKSVKVLVLVITVGMIFFVACSGPSRPQGRVEIPQLESLETSEGSAGMKVTAEGYGLTHEEAVRDALLKAVQEAVGFTLTGRTVVSNYTLLDKTSFARVKGYVKHYRVTMESTMQTGIVEVKVEAWVSQSIEEDVTELIRMMNKPRVGVLVLDERGGLCETAVTAVSKVLTDKGFYVVAPKLHDGLQLPSFDDLTPAEVLSLGEELDVDMLIFGRVATSDLGDVLGYGFKSSRSSLRLQAYWVGSQELVVSRSGEVGAADISQTVAREKSIQQVAETVTTVFVEDLLGKWLEMSGSGFTVRFVLTGLDYDTYQKLRERLSYTQFVAGVYPREYDANRGRAVFDVDLVGSPEWVLRSLEASLGLHFEVKKMNLTKVIAEVERGW